jgi:hypothetical protein
MPVDTEKERRDRERADRDQAFGPLPSAYPAENADNTAAEDSSTAKPPEASGGSWDSPPQQQADVSGAQPQQQASYGAPEQPVSAPGPGSAYEQAAQSPSAPSAAAVSQYSAMQGVHPSRAADELSRLNASPGTGYRQTGPGQFEPVPGGPADPATQQQPPIDPRTGYPRGMAMLRTANGAQLMPDTPQNRLNDLNHNIQQVQLSQPEQIRAQALQQSMAGVDEAVQRGDLTPQDGARLRQQIQQQGEQLWARQGSLPEMLMRQQFLQQQHQMAQQTALANENATAFAQRVADHTHTYPDGTRIYTDPQGRSTVIPPHEPRAQPADHSADQEERRRVAAETAHARIVQHHTDAVRREAVAAGREGAQRPAWMGRADYTMDGERHTPERQEIERRVAEHYAVAGTQPPAPRQRNESATRSPEERASPRGEEQSPQETTARRFDQMREIIQNHSVGFFRGNRNALDRVDELQHLVQQHPNAETLPRDNPVRQQFDDLRTRIQDVIRQHNRPAPAPSAPGRVGNAETRDRNPTGNPIIDFQRRILGMST